MLYRTLAIFPSKDLNRTAEFYEGKMGFRRVDYMESKEPPYMTDYFNYEFKVRDIDGRELIFGKKQWNTSGDKIWEELYSRAKSLLHDRRLSPLMQAGSVAAAIMTKQGNIFTGVCILIRPAP